MSIYEVHCESNGIKSVHKGFEDKGKALAFARSFAKTSSDRAVLIEDTQISFDVSKRFKVLFRSSQYALCWLDLLP